MQPRTPIIVGAFVAALIAGLLMRYWGPALAAGTKVKEHFMQREVGMPVTAGVEPVGTANTLLGSEPRPTPQVPYDMASDGSLYFLAENKVGADCCQNTIFTSDSGCVCLTPEQKAILASRGGNRE